MNFFERIFPDDGKPQLWILIDPESAPSGELVEVAKAAEENNAALILVGGSMLFHADFDHVIKIIKDATNLPVVIFPGSSRQVSRHADGILFTSLFSGRNPQYLIDEQVHAAPIIRRLGLPVVPTAYLLIESGRTTSIEYVSNTRSIPRHKPLIAAAHAQAAELFGMKAVYLEAGSGADNPVPLKLIKIVSEAVSIPVIVGGGISSGETALQVVNNGARVVVVGTAIEKNGRAVISEIASALRGAGE